MDVECLQERKLINALTKGMGSMIFGKDKMISYLYRFLLLAIPLI